MTNTPHTTHAEQPPREDVTTMDTAAAARLLGVKPASVRKAISRGRIPIHGRNGNQVVLLWRDVEAYKQSEFGMRSTRQRSRRFYERLKHAASDGTLTRADIERELNARDEQITAHRARIDVIEREWAMYAQLLLLYTEQELAERMASRTGAAPLPIAPAPRVAPPKAASNGHMPNSHAAIGHAPSEDTHRAAWYDLFSAPDFADTTS